MSTITDTKPSITIFRGWKDFGKHVWSPFVIKLEARMRFAGIRYAVDVGSPRTAPKGKVPYVECRRRNGSDQGEEEEEEVQQVADSTLIIQTLTQWGDLPDLNAALSGPDAARDMALRALLEDKLYFYHVRNCTMEPKQRGGGGEERPTFGSRKEDRFLFSPLVAGT
jgi:hypothetical protein